MTTFTSAFTRAPRRKKYNGVIPTWTESFTDLPLPKMVREKREVMAISQQVFADGMFRTQPWVSQLELGKVWNITFLDVLAIHKALSIPIEDICRAATETARAVTGVSGLAMIPQEGEGVLVVTKTGLSLKSNVVTEGVVDSSALLVPALIPGNTQPTHLWEGVSEEVIPFDSIPLTD